MTRASRFEGKIGKTISDSEAWFDEPPHPGDDAPNVVVVLLDDTGFAQFGCYGSDIDTPNVDALAAGGAQFTNFHVTPLCSPTRASLLTGRSQHAVGMRAVSNFRTGFPSQLGHFSYHLIVESDIDVPIGVSELGVQVRRTGGKTGTIVLTIDGVANEAAELPLFMTMMSSVGPSVGYDCGSAVSQRYVGPFPFEGALHEIVVQLLSRTAIEAERANAASEMSRQ
ncbi:MAG: hypothetical protein ACI9SB_002600 [Candidatus Azotimanducaceae bacterium]|jgi:hypothetical protein